MEPNPFPWYKRVRISTRIALGTALIATLCWLILAFFSYTTTNLLLDLSSRHLFKSASGAIKTELQASYASVKQATEMLAYSQLVQKQTPEERMQLVPWMIETLDVLPAAATIQLGTEQGDYFIVRTLTSEHLQRQFQPPPGTAYSADHLNGSTSAFERRFYDAEGRLLQTLYPPSPDYDPRTRPWYQKAQASNASITTQPYVFFFMQEVGLTVAHTSNDKHSVVAIDITLSSVNKSLEQQKLTLSSDAVMHVDHKVLAHGNQDSIITSQDGRLRQLTLEELDNPIFTLAVQDKELSGWLISRTVLELTSDTRPELILAVPEAELLTEFGALRQQMLLLSSLILLLMVAISWLLASRLSSPIKLLHAAIGDIGKGNFDFTLPKIQYADEVGDLNLAMRSMRGSLKQHIQQLAEARGHQERLEGELDVARRIQMNMVPGDGELSARFNDVDIYAWMQPARQVGGDLYMAYQTQQGRIFIAVGDVSDKGAAAALFMARTQTLLALLPNRTHSVSELLAEVNDALANANDACMFTTLFCGFYDPKSGELEYASAGHNPPVLISADGITLLNTENGSPLGIFEAQDYPTQHLQLAPGDSLLIYTDGITEAFDTARNEFGESRLISALQAVPANAEATTLSHALMAEVYRFVGDAEQSDDITLMAMRRAPCNDNT